MLKQLRIRNSIFKLTRAIEKATATAENLKKRQYELEMQLRSDDLSAEDEKVIDEAIGNLETEITEFGETVKADIESAGGEVPDDIGETVDEQVSALKEALNKLEEELKDTEPDPEPASEPADDGNRASPKVKGVRNMKIRGIFSSLPLETRNSIMNAPETKTFIEQVRAMGQNRGVTKVELTIPNDIVDVIRDNLHKYSKLIGYVNVKSVPGKSRQTVIGTPPEAIWTEMTAAINELSLSFAQIEVDGYKVSGYIAIANAYLEDSDIDLAAEIVEALTQGIGLAIDKAILYGTGTKMPVGIVTRLAQSSKPSTWGDNEPTWSDLHTSNIIKMDCSSYKDAQFFAALIKNLGVIKANYAAATEKFWCMNEKTKTEILSRSVTFNSAGAIVAGVNEDMPIIGGKIIEMPFMSDGDIVGGYGSLYYLAERAGMSIASSEHAKFLDDQMVYRATARYDGRPVFGEGFVAVNINNTAITTSVTFAGTTASQSTPSGSDQSSTG